MVGAIPNDWSLTGIVHAAVGCADRRRAGDQLNAFAGFGTQRPNLVGDPTLPFGRTNASRAGSTPALRHCAAVHAGIGSRNPVRGPGYRIRLALSAASPIAARTTLEVRVEVFNVTNTPPLGAPNGTFGSAAFGTITSAGDPRVFQLALRLLF